MYTYCKLEILLFINSLFHTHHSHLQPTLADGTVTYSSPSNQTFITPAMSNKEREKTPRFLAAVTDIKHKFPLKI